MYSLWTPTSDDDRHTYVKAKDIPKAHVKKHVRHQQYLHVLRSWSPTRCEFRAFRSAKHEVTTRKLKKICLTALDDKRYLLPDGIASLPYGHRDIPKAPDALCASEGERAPLSLSAFCTV